MEFKQLDPVAGNGSAEAVYAARYEWLLRWAMHFCNGDREAAEDLVQDTFVQMLASWSSIRDTEHPERFLYTYLRYGFLRHRSLGLRYSIHELTPPEYDSIRAQPATDKTNMLEWQSDLRSIVTYLCWRKATTKSASIMLFRFFHGYFPSEIMRIAGMSRKAVDEALANAKEEAKTYIASPQKLKIMHRGALPTPVSTFHSTLSTEEFVAEMLEQIYAARDGSCLSAEALGRYYDEHSRVPIDCWLLSHLVSCPECLKIVSRRLELPPGGTRPLDDVLGYAPRSEFAPASRTENSRRNAKQSIAGVKERYCDALKQRPNTLMIRVNGHHIASRDLHASVNEMTVEFRNGNTPELIEITSERDLLLAIPVLFLPPEAPPQQKFKIELGEGRYLTVHLNFTVDGASIRILYDDSLAVPITASLEPHTKTSKTSIDRSQQIGFTDRVHQFLEWFGRKFDLRLRIAGGLAALVFIGVLMLRGVNLHTGNDLLVHAVKAASNMPKTGVEYQKLRIAINGQAFIESEHRDLSKKRHTKHPQVTPQEQQMEAKLGVAGIERHDPLSAASYREWHDRQSNATDTVVLRNGNLLTLTTVVPNGAVREASLTLRADTLHPIVRTVQFRDNEHIEIAELEYDVMPWEKSNPEWFEPLAGTSHSAGINAHAVSPSFGKNLIRPTEGQLDEAELGVRLALVELHAEGQERLSVSRTAEAVSVSGVVATEERKSEIARRLRMVPHVISSLRTFSESENAPANLPHSATLGSSENESTMPLDQLIEERHRSVAEENSIHAALLDAAIDLRQSATALSDLEHRFARERLSGEGSKQYSSLLQVYSERTRNAASRELQALLLLGGTFPAAKNHAPEEGLSAVALHNSQLCLELISRETRTPRPSQTILDELSSSYADLQQAIEQRSITASHTYSPASSEGKQKQ